MKPVCKFQLSVLLALSAIISIAGAVNHPTPNIAAVTIQQAHLMDGFPPQESFQVTKANMGQYPYIRWTLQNISRLFPVTVLTGGNNNSALLPRSIEQDILAQPFIIAGKPIRLNDYADQTSTDALVVLHNGKIVDEWYGNGMTPLSQHYLASITKSMTGLLAELMIYRGELNPARKVQTYLPELKSSPFGSVTVRQLLDMQVNVGVGETALKPDQETLDMWRVMGWSPSASTMGMYEFLPTIKAAGNNDGNFHYSSLTTEVAGWLLSRVSGKGVEQLLQQEILEKIGTTAPVYAVVDQRSKMLSSAGLNMSARDLARIGQLIANYGVLNGQQIIPSEVIQSIFQHGNVKAWENGSFAGNGIIRSYKSYWYQLAGGDNAIMGMGVFGQSLYINPLKNIVVVKFASQPADIIDEYGRGWAEIMFQMIERLGRLEN